MHPVKVVDPPNSNMVLRQGNVSQEEVQDMSYLGTNGGEDTGNDQTNPVEASLHEKEEKPQVGKPQPFSHHIWDPEVRPMLIAYLKPVFMMTLIVMVMVWLFCSIYLSLIHI